MNEEEQWKLQHNHQILISDIPDEVIQELFSKGTINRDDLNRISAKNATEDKNKLLLQILPTRGPSAYLNFRQILTIRNCKYLGDLLDKTPPKVCEKIAGDSMETECDFATKTPLEVKQWLIDTCEFSEEQAQDFESQEISGKALCRLMKRENRDAFIKQFVSPNLTAGKILNLDDEFSKLLVAKSTNSPLQAVEPARKHVERGKVPSFRQRGKSGKDSRYVHNKRYSLPEVPENDLLADFHYFNSCADGFNDATVLKEVVSTIAACLNAFQNGIIHLGVHTNGTVNGIQLESDVYCLRQRILESFPEDQRKMIGAQISQLVFIDVEDSEANVSSLKVIELGITPSVDNQEIFVTFEQDKSSIFFVLESGKVEQLVSVKQKKFLKERFVWRKAREMALKGGDRRPPSFFSEKFSELADFMTLGNDHIDDGMFPILVANSLPDTRPSSEEVADRYSFVDAIQWSAVFDFDNRAEICKYLMCKGESISIKKIGDIDRDDIHILASNYTPWTFMNGYEETGIEEPVQWRRQYTDGLRNIISVLQKEVPSTRAMVIIALLSTNFEIMLEIFTELDRAFPNHWCVVCEDEELLDRWNKEVINRKYQKEGVVLRKSIAGIPWHLFSEYVKLLHEPKLNVICKIPSSRGAITFQEQNDLTSLEVVGMDECEEQLKKLTKVKDVSYWKRQEETRFFKGGKVSWQNFAYEHVCQRHIHSKLFKFVEETLGGKPSDNVDGDCVGIINFYHQPGAGATTSSRHVLWELRKRYRCAVAKEISPSKTSEHVFRLRTFGEERESQTRPVLVLLDNEDPENIRQLRTELETLAKRQQWEERENQREDENFEESSFNRFSVVLLICRRQTTIPAGESFALRHQLYKEELDWFGKKYEELELEYKNRGGFDPRYLFSFNIMKTSFNKDAIKGTVENLLGNMTDTAERMILKYVSLLNYFDQDFRPVPVCAFDQIMSYNHKPNSYSFGVTVPRRQRSHLSSQPQWERTASESWKLLVSKTRCNNYKGITACNRILAKQILDTFTQKQTVSEICNELLDCTEITQKSTYFMKPLHDIVRDVLKKRVQEEGLDHKSKYAPLIDHVMNAESHQIAADLLEKGYKIFNDPFIAQQIARFFMYSETDSYNDHNHQRALYYAKAGLEQRPESSYLHDTYGQVYKQQLVKALKVQRESDHTIAPALDVIRCAFDAITAFKEAQRYSLPGSYQGVTNMAGYHGELDTINRLLKFLQNIPELCDEDLRKFFFQHDYYPDSVQCWQNSNHELVQKLKVLGQTVQETLVVVEELQTQVREEYLDNVQLAQKKSMQMEIAKVKENLQYYFGEDKNEVPDSLEELGKSEYRRRRALRLCGNSFSAMVQMSKTKEVEANNVLRDVCQLMSDNWKSEFKNSMDLLILLGAYITRACILETSLNTLKPSYDVLVKWSHDLFEQRTTISQCGIYLEPYLFYVMLNWPSLGDKDKQRLPTPLNRVIEYWKNDYDKKYPPKSKHQFYGIKQKTVFFLAKGDGIERFVHHSKFKTNYHGQNFWVSGEVKDLLNQFEGRMTDKLDSVEFFYGTFRDQILKIPSAVPVSFDTWRHKRVKFYIGITWSGPVAYGILKPSSSSVSSSAEETPICEARSGEPFCQVVGGASPRAEHQANPTASSSRSTSSCSHQTSSTPKKDQHPQAKRGRKAKKKKR